MSFKKIDREDNERKSGRNCILVYGYNNAELEVLETCLRKSGIDEMVIISEMEINLSLEKILEKEAFNKEENSVNEVYSMVQTVIFSGTSHLELDQFIEATKSIEITRPIFAGTTSHNLSWAFRDLVEELVKEREEMKKMRTMNV